MRTLVDIITLARKDLDITTLVGKDLSIIAPTSKNLGVITVVTCFITTLIINA